MRLDFTHRGERNWYCVDLDRYDGAPDAAPQIMGFGPTKEAALIDWFWDFRMKENPDADTLVDLFGAAILQM